MDLIGPESYMTSRLMGGLPAALSDPEGPESLFFAGPKKSNPKKWPEELVGYAG
jgi:hypothetical protein